MAPIPEESSFFVSIFAEVILKKSSKQKRRIFRPGPTDWLHSQ